MRTRPLICAAAACALLIGQAPSMAATDDPTAVSGIDVVVKKTTRLSELEVSVPLCGKAKPATDDPGFKNGNSIVQRAGPLDDAQPSPKLVSSFPGKGDTVRPGLLVLRLTFDRPMSCIGLLESDMQFPNPCPPPLRTPMISRDKRTFLTVCRIQANRRFSLWLSNFTSVGGRAMPRSELVFYSSQDSDISTVERALAQDKWLQKASQPGG